MKRALFVAATALVLASCGGTSSNNATSDTTNSGTAPTADVTTTAATATTVAATTTTVAVDEDVVKCPTSTFSAQFKTKMRMLDCTTTWAIGRYDRDTWNCPSDGCVDARIFHLENGVWVDKATCYTTEPLIPGKRRCYVPDVGVATDADLPPASIACKIWPTNRQLVWVSETGCEPSAAEIAAALSTKCDSWTATEFLPYAPCASGAGVKVMQRALREAGYPVDADGYNGPGTVKQIAAFQTKQNVPKTGLMDLATWKLLLAAAPSLKGTDTNNDGVVTPDEIN